MPSIRPMVRSTQLIHHTATGLLKQVGHITSEIPSGTELKRVDRQKQGHFKLLGLANTRCFAVPASGHCKIVCLLLSGSFKVSEFCKTLYMVVKSVMECLRETSSRELTWSFSILLSAALSLQPR